jgi:hypothetical protein
VNGHALNPLRTAIVTLDEPKPTTIAVLADGGGLYEG